MLVIVFLNLIIMRTIYGPHLQHAHWPPVGFALGDTASAPTQFLGWFLYKLQAGSLKTKKNQRKITV